MRRGHTFTMATLVLGLTGPALAETVEFQEARLLKDYSSVTAMAEADGVRSETHQTIGTTYNQPLANDFRSVSETASSASSTAEADASANFSMSQGSQGLMIGDGPGPNVRAETSLTGEGANFARARQGFQIDFELSEASYLELTGQLRTAELTGFDGWGRVWLTDDEELLFRRDRPGSFSSDRLTLPAGAYQVHGTFATPAPGSNDSAEGSYTVAVQAEPVPLPNAAWLGLSLLAVLAGGAGLRRWRAAGAP